MTRFVVKAAGTWMGLLAAIVLLGGLRETFLRPAFGELRAHQIGTLAACAMAATIIASFVWHEHPTPRQGLLVGASWLALAVVLEFGLGTVRGVPWARLWADYDISQGRLLPLLWLTVLLTPYWAAREWTRP
jgi:hypothetical protein